MNTIGKGLDNMLPSGAFRCRNPGILKSVGIYSGNRQETLQKLKPPSGIIITLGIMTVTWVTPGDQHAIGSPLKRLEDKQRINPT